MLLPKYSAAHIKKSKCKEFKIEAENPEFENLARGSSKPYIVSDSEPVNSHLILFPGLVLLNKLHLSGN